MKSTKTLLIFCVLSTLTLNLHAQEAKIKKAQEYIAAKEFSEAREIIIKIIEKNPNDFVALYFTELIDYKTGFVNKDMIKKLNHIQQHYSEIKSEEKSKDSIKFDVSKTAIILLKKEITAKALTLYYINSRNLDSLEGFKTDYEPSPTQIARITERICQVRFDRINFDNRNDLVQYSNTNDGCIQIKLVVDKLETMDWISAKENNSIEGYIKFKNYHTKSTLIDSADQLIHEIRWNTTLQQDNHETYKDFIANNPKSPHVLEANKRYEKQLWESTKISIDTAQIIYYINNCRTCEHKGEAYDLIENIHWLRINSTSDTNTLNYFINKWPNSDKGQLAYNQKINIVKFKDRINKIPLTPIMNDFSWDERLTIYQKSAGQFMRTKVYSDGKLGVRERIVENINILMDVDEIVIGDKNIIYNLTNKKSNESPMLISNFDGLIGLEINDLHVSQRLSNSFLTFSSGYEIYDIQTREFIPVQLPNYNFSFNRPCVFPYFRIAYPDYLYSGTFKSRGHSEYYPSTYNSDLIYSINKNQFFCLNNSGLDYKVNFGSGQKLCMINDDIYKIENLEKVLVFNESQSTNEEVDSTNEDVDSFKGKIHPKIVTFNDSVFVWYHEKDNILEINRTNNKLVNTIDLSQLPGFVSSWDKAGFNFIEIDQFGQYLYIEWKPVAHDDDKIFTTPYNNSLLAVIDCKISKFVYMGPHIGIDHSTEKIGWVMTKAIMSFKNEDVKTSKSRQDPVEKHGLMWGLTNYSAPVSADKYTFLERKSLYTIDRSLINLSSLICDDYMLQLHKMIEKKAPVEDIFNRNFVAERKQFLKDSLVAKAHLWVQPNTRSVDSQKIKIEIEPNYDIKVLNHCAKYYIDPESDPSGDFIQFIPKLTDLKRQGDLFSFSFRIDSLPAYIVDSKVRISDKYMCTIYSGTSEVGRVIQKELPYSLQDSNYITYFFDIVTNKEQFARVINDKVKTDDLQVHFSSEWNSSFLLESFEVYLIEQDPSISRMNLKNYWFDLINDCKSQRISPWQVSLQLVFISEDAEEWELPILLKSEELKINPRY